MMSATCPPKQLESILENLKIKPEDIDILSGELTRPEVRYIRLEMTKSRKSLEDLLHNFDIKSRIPDNEVPPTLIYSGTRHATMQALIIANRACGTSGDELNPESLFGRRYTSCTGPTDKLDRVQDFSDEKFPVCSCTNALGLGQNWTRVRRVIQVGRAAPWHLSQVTGRCGRDGRPGLAIIYVEKTRRGGKNKIEDFDWSQDFTEDDMLDGFAITGVCLRIALTLSNRCSD